MKQILSKHSDCLWTTSKFNLSRAVWTWHASYWDIYDKSKSLIKASACMEFYDETKPLYLETDASGIGLGATLLQTRDDTSCPKDSAQDNTILQPGAFVSKSLTHAECRYRNIERGTGYTAQSQKISSLLFC